MWLIIQTDTYKEQDVLADIKKVRGFKDVFLPLYRKERVNANKKEIVFLPLITRILFLNIDIPTFGDDEDTVRSSYLHSIFNDSGYILKIEESKDGGRIVTKDNIKARLMCVANDNTDSLWQRVCAARISDSDVESLRLFVDQMNSTMTEYTVVDDNYNLIASTQDTVMFTEGPYQGFQGVVKQKNVKGIRSHYLYIRVANWTFCIPNARKGRYIVLKEAAHGDKAKEVTAWTNIDLLLQRFQNLSLHEGLTEEEAMTLADDSALLLRQLLLNLGRKTRIEDFVATTASDARLKDKPLSQLLLLFLAGAKFPNDGMGSQNVVRPVLSAREASALISLNRYYISRKDSLDYVLGQYIPDVTLRPFLTPYVVNKEREGELLRKIPHRDFTEYIYIVNLAPLLWQSSHALAAAKGEDDFTFAAHIGVRGDTCFVNWGDFSRKCQESLSPDFIADLNKKGLVRLAALLQSEKHSFYDDPKNHIHGLSWKLPEGTDPSQADDNSLFEALDFMSLAEAAVEVWQSTRLLPFRNLLRRSVLLHRAPVIDQLPPVNQQLEDILYDENGMPRRLTEDTERELDAFVENMDNALKESMQVNRVKYVVTHYHQLLASVNGYMEAIMEKGETESFAKLDKICTAASDSIRTNIETLDAMDGLTNDEDKLRKNLLKQIDKVMAQYTDTISYIKKSPAYISTGIPTCLGKRTLGKNKH